MRARQAISKLGIIIFAILLAIGPVSGQKRTKKAEVFVLATLHQFHADSKYYSFDQLSQIIRDVRPDVICVELTGGDIKSRRKQSTKVEYEKSVFPVADKYNYQLVPLEPDEPKFSTLVSLNVESERELRTADAGKAEAFSLFTDGLYAHLFSVWRSPLDVNSSMTDSHFEVKHNYQNALYGDKQRRVWEEWNGHFLEQVLNTARSTDKKKVLVLVGVEHAYWLRKALRKQKGVHLREAPTFIK